MPLYDYQCATCKEITEVRHGFDEVYGEACPTCGGKLVRLFNPASIVFKGSGFYITDSRKATENAASAKAKNEAKADAPKSDAPKSDTAKTPPATSPAPGKNSKESAA